jgi:tetratricopeptide (TPR) repeat protein
VAHLILGHINILANRAAQEIAECEQALRINPNSANAYSMIGYAKYCMGRAVETKGHVMEALRLSPLDIHAYWWMFCLGWPRCNSASTPKPLIG